MTILDYDMKLTQHSCIIHVGVASSRESCVGNIYSDHPSLDGEWTLKLTELFQNKFHVSHVY